MSEPKKYTGKKRGRKPGPTGKKMDYFRIRASSSEKRLINLMARKYAKGDVSRWLRFAAMNFHPESIASGE